jgi:non-heme chloroperoxidase
VRNGSGRGAVLLIHGLWFRRSVWTPWLAELDEAGYDAAVLSWSGDARPSSTTPPAADPDFDAVLRAARRDIKGWRSRPIVIGHGVGGAVAERLLNDGDAVAAISLAPVPGGYAAVPTAVRLLCRKTGLALLSLRGSSVMPTFRQFRRTIASVSGDTEARHFYENHVAAGKPRGVLFPALRRRAPARSRQPRRGPLLLVAGGKDDLVQEVSIALLHRSRRRREPDAITDYQVFPDLDHTLGLGTQEVAVLFYCLDWLTAQNM